MLIDPVITAFLPTVNPELSKQFYRHILGLKLISEDNFALEFESKGVILRITIVDKFVPHPFTVLGFKIRDIGTQVKLLSEKGIAFERFSALKQDESGIWTSPGNAKIAWFKDPDKNLISLTEKPQ